MSEHLKCSPEYNGEYMGNTLFLAPEGDVELSGNILSFDNSSGEYNRGEMKISFCPWCGKKLE